MTRNALIVEAIHSMPVTGRAGVLAIEERIRNELVPVELTVDHGFAPGVYARKLFIPAGTVLTGKIHKYAHWNIVLSGHIVIRTADGDREYKGGSMFVSPAGTKRAGYAVQDTVWVTMHPTTETDPEVIEQQTVVETFQEFDALTLLAGTP